MPALTFSDDVRGFVIGAVDTKKHYLFLECGKPICTGNFENDVAAAEWFREKYPERFKRGVEMRVWDV